VHYEPTEESDVPVVNGNLLLVDSGAQYLDGTTDITRTVSLGTPNELQKRDFTLVMKGHIALGTMIFPAETRGAQLDAVARMFLWREGLTYLHGTGHGVGHFLNVHEGPQSIRLNNTPTPLMLGMITSNEPGLYREDVHGIRCENLVLTVPAMTTEFGEFQKFETLTLFPFDLKLFDTSIMTDEEIAWVNDYHNTVRTILTPMLNTDEERAWLAAKTAPLTH
jgi:Xaa-Pro aminopeptidase